MLVETWPQNIITELGFLLIGGTFAAIPIYVLGLVLKGKG